MNRRMDEIEYEDLNDGMTGDKEFSGGSVEAAEENPAVSDTAEDAASGEEDNTEDIYRIYMEEIAAIPPCTEEETLRLLSDVKNGKPQARERLIEGNLKKALFYVQDYINKGVSMADLIQEASMELMMLVDEGFEGSFERLLESRIRVRLEEILNEQ